MCGAPVRTWPADTEAASKKFRGGQGAAPLRLRPCPNKRAREAQALAPLGLHTHWTAPDHARPTGGDPAALVREQGEWLRSVGLDVQLFCGGSWCLDADVAQAVAELGYADCTATAFRPLYLEPGAAHVQLDEPAWLDVGGGQRLLELPTTHSIGMLARGLLGPFRRQVVFTHSWSTPGAHTIRIVCAGTAGHPRIDVDALLRLP